MNTLIIIQARQNSKRFPNKVMHRLGHKPVIQYLIDFVKSIQMSVEQQQIPDGLRGLLKR